MIPAHVPTATVKKLDGGIAFILCPICGETHRHEGARPGATEWRAAACALNVAVSRSTRLAGYTFTINSAPGKK